MKSSYVRDLTYAVTTMAAFRGSGASRVSSEAYADAAWKLGHKGQPDAFDIFSTHTSRINIPSAPFIGCDVCLFEQIAPHDASACRLSKSPVPWKLPIGLKAALPRASVN